MSIYTKGGDKGETSLLGGVRVPKDSLRIEVYGTLDEVTSALGLARATTVNEDICKDIIDLQGEFIDIMGELASGPWEGASPVQLPKGRSFRTGPEHVERLERMIDRLQAERIPYPHFVKPGGSQASAAMDMARTFARRAERRLVSLGREEQVNPSLAKYFNRLSDLLYMMARIDEQRAVMRSVEKQVRGALADNGNATHGMMLGLADCDRLLEAGISRAGAIGVPMVLTVVDAAGQLVEFRRMDGALVISTTLAPNKAYTAAAVRMATHELARLAQPEGPLFGIETNIPKLTLIGGGLPLMRNGGLAGAVGVSGGSVEQDIDVARTMVAAFHGMMEN